MKKLRVRSFMILAPVLISASAWVTYVIVRFAATGTLVFGSEDRAPDPDLIWFSSLFGFALAVFLIGYAMRKWIARPLEAMGEAARRIAGGDLDVELPESRIREIAEAREGFEAMVAGLRQSVERRAELEEERRFFIGAIAHDLRTPLFALRGYLDGLDQGIASSPEQMKKYVAVCKEKSNQLDRLVSDLFAYAKTEYRETVRLEDHADLAEVVHKSVDGIRRAAESKNISVRAEIPGEACPARGDAHLLERAVSNLLDNAARHTPAHGEIFVRCHAEGGRAVVTVRDTGSGFALSDLERVFEPLYRGEASRNRDTGGAGLGLTIARRIFRAHGGDLAAANRPEGGAELTGWLPVSEGGD
ncbi:sensor histidine kinase [Cohnella massiliensis]|uniref:sensor histidine kinase n=2 Tax=Cohnella TaxID=329857 RepID=UPI0009BB5105|nr:HAMP domain-containing sensor histidine kinase [Cohnella massiliensis]